MEQNIQLEPSRQSPQPAKITSKIKSSTSFNWHIMQTQSGHITLAAWTYRISGIKYLTKGSWSPSIFNWPKNPFIFQLPKPSLHLKSIFFVNIFYLNITISIKNYLSALVFLLHQPSLSGKLALASSCLHYNKLA